jgi:hypothetical protein
MPFRANLDMYKIQEILPLLVFCFFLRGTTAQGLRFTAAYRCSTIVLNVKAEIMLYVLFCFFVL